MALIKTNIDFPGKDINLIVRQILAETLFHTKFGARVIEAIKSKYFYFDISNNFEFQANDNCPTTGFDDITLNQVTKTVCEMMMIGEMSKDDLIATAREYTQRQGAKNDNVLDDTVLMEAVLANLIETAANQLDNIILNGDTVTPAPGILGLCNGFRRQWWDGGQYVPVVSVPANLVATGGAILGEIQKLIDNVNPDLMYNSRFTPKIGVSLAIARAYQQYLNQNQANNAFITEEAPLRYAGIELVPLRFLPATEMFLTNSENLIIAHDDQNDSSDFRIVDLSVNSLCDKIQMKLKVRIGVTTGIESNVVWYRSNTAF